jgi:hypothetical protein
LTIRSLGVSSALLLVPVTRLDAACCLPLLPLAGELGEPVECLGFRGGGVDRLEVFRDDAPVFLRGVLERISQEMNNAGLHDCLLPHRAHRIRQAFQPVADQQAHVPHTAVLDFRQDPQPELGALPVAVLPSPQAQHVTLAVHGDAQGQVDGPVGDLALADLHVNGIDKQDGINRVERPALPFRHAFHHPVGDRGNSLLRHLRAIDLGQVRADLPVGQPFRRQGNHHLLHPGQPPLPFGDDFRLETRIRVPRHQELHWPSPGEHGLGPVPIAGIAAITAGRVMLAVAEVVIQLALQGTLDHHLGQPAQQPALAGQLQPAAAGPLGKLPQQLLIGSRELRSVLVMTARHVCHWCLLRLGSYTVEMALSHFRW